MEIEHRFPREACGVFGIYGHKDASRLAYLGLYALQHRGEESAGIVSYDGKKIFSCKAQGLVREVFSEANIKSLKGHLAIGHNRYSTTGSSTVKNIQPFLVNFKNAPIAVAHNGNLVNTVQLHKILEKEGSIFQTTMDSEIVVHLIAKAKDKEIKDRVVGALKQLSGSYSLVLMIDNCLIGARDPGGFKPLCLGQVDGAYVLASETCALDLIGATYLRDIDPGEIVFINKEGLISLKPFAAKKNSFCIFEFIYFARPDSNIFGNHNVYLARKSLGEQLAQEFPKVNADLITPIPDSGVYASVGFAQKSSMPFEMGMIRNHYVGRTFIQPSQAIRNFRVKVKLNPIKDVIKDKKIVIVEDSIVRGTTSKGRVRALREAGAKEIHMGVTCPPLKFPCFFGIDFPTKKELIASSHSVEWIRDFIGVDSLKYLSKEGMLKAMPLPKENFCTACFDGCYPVKPCKRISKDVLEKE
ncbi:MAG: amidophosphoribosyltransferase [Candidatus Omnitrophota bacterium]